MAIILAKITNKYQQLNDITTVGIVEKKYTEEMIRIIQGKKTRRRTIHSKEVKNGPIQYHATLIEKIGCSYSQTPPT